MKHITVTRQFQMHANSIVYINPRENHKLNNWTKIIYLKEVKCDEASTDISISLGNSNPIVIHWKFLLHYCSSMWLKREWANVNTCP